MSTAGEEGKPLTLEASSPSPIRSKRAKLLFGTVAVLCVAAALAVAAAVLPLSSHQVGGAKKLDDVETEGNVRYEMVDSEIFQRSTDNELDPHQFDVEENSARPNSRGQPVKGFRPAAILRKRPNMSSNGSLSTGSKAVAAHISGAKHMRWPRQPDPTTSAYKTFWDCSPYGMPYMPDSSPDAYVQGGMHFLQTDKSLYVPKCGYYHIYSQILFKVTTHESEAAQKVYHQLHFERNCSSVVHEATLMSYASVGTNSDSSMTVTTHTSDVVKLCRGGRLWIDIPAGPGRSACCPKGGNEASGNTFFGAVLISEDKCDWPPMETMAS